MRHTALSCLRLCVLGFCLGMSLCLAACLDTSLPGGVVATVNGQPIALRTLETMLDTRTTALGIFENPSLVTLRHQYGKALIHLIGQVLVMQELDRRGMGVSDAALMEAEQAIRDDYTEEEFEKIFIENAIDIDAWRELMRHRIAMERFISQVLRPIIHVPLENIEAYYAQHTAGFTVPRTAVIWQLQSSNRTALMQALSTVPPQEVPEVNIFRITMPYGELPPEWNKAVNALSVGEYVPPRAKAELFEALWLEASTPQRHLTLLEAYPYILQILTEEKLETVFQDWLASTLSASQVRVSTHLLQQVRGEEQ